MAQIRSRHRAGRRARHRRHKRENVERGIGMRHLSFVMGWGRIRATTELPLASAGLRRAFAMAAPKVERDEPPVVDGTRADALRRFVDRHG